MDRSVWYDEIDLALSKLVLKLLSIDGVPVPCKFFKEEDDFSKDIPCVLVTALNDDFNLFRYDPEPVQVSIQDGTATYEESAKPYTLTYQIELLTNYREHMNILTRHWLNEIPKRYYLDVVDSSGEKRKCYMRLVDSRDLNGNFKVHGEKKLRIFRKTFVYQIWVELDIVKSKEVNIPNKGVSFNNK